MRVSRDDRGSMPMALLLTLVGTSLSALLVPIVVNQIGSTRTEVQRVHALHAAQTGIDVAVAHVRAAVDAAGNGLVTALPCGPFTGRVGAGGTARYQVSVDYLASDPRGQSAGWVTANRLTCVPGAGTASTPAYALLHADGTDRATGAFGTVPARTVQATYAFQTSNQYRAGGLIHVHRSGADPDLCLDAGSGSPGPGVNLQVQACDPASAAQRFTYNRNLTLVLAASRTAALPLGRCVDAGAAHAANTPVQMQSCAAVTLPQQQWSFTDRANFEGTGDGVTLDGFCFNVQMPGLSGSFVVLGSAGAGRCRSAPDNRQTFAPAAAVGAGAAGPSAGQLVNFNQFGRCLEVTGQDVNYGYLIVAPCTQAPDPTAVTWSQKWKLPAITGGAVSASGPIVTDPGTPYCLRSPGNTGAGRYVTTVPCPGEVAPANGTWTVYADTGTDATSYRIQDPFGYCLSATDPTVASPDLHPTGDRISKVVVAECSGATLQKWNAPANLLLSEPLRDVTEK